ncbi:leucyl aminopeptidase [Proteiniclasticum sp. SCR006]|uniref:Probable cytosol aminopeptidase n=1 Tax=Proteiniclasticum aestuarii TaxID=2817862 RepID=A0A939HBK3_9CLOT|nr:leucyl aminopeptidase [Proteiniclasticum aestuarii]MBO1264986.1 leucyl aminopeptidase [Proteiniclasticum aestuarii]
MKITIGQKENAKLILVCKDQTHEGLEKVLEQLKEKDLFKGEAEELFSHVDMESGKVSVYLGLGEEEKVDEEALRLAAFKGAKELSKLKIRKASAKLPKFSGLCYRKSSKAFAEGLYHAEYRFDKYLSKKKDFHLEEVSLILLEGKEEKVLPELSEIENLMDGIFLTRNLINEPAITLTPVALAKAAKEELEPLGVEVTILGREACEKLGMTAFLSVAKGSTNEPQGIIMRYKGGKDEAPIGLVGKGVTFDTGGYSLKPGPSMMTMNGDMGGSGVVIGAMKAIALNKVKRNVTAVVLATDNVISGDAYVPGDIVGSMAGKTIEIHSTDAEGRLTLADAVYYSIKHEGVSEVVDVATLTGACVVALGEFNTGAFTNSKELYGKIEKAAEEAGEPMWQLPLSKGYRDLIKGDRGDLKNTGGRWGGASTAAAFIEAFVEDTPWVHLDIAGTSDIAAARGYLPKGATGMPVKTLYYYAKGAKK